jgi:multiple sugar transport system substrate-binding protein
LARSVNAPPPSPLTGGGYAHGGLAIGAKANKDDAAKKCAGLFIAWATPNENEKRRLDDGEFGELNRASIMTSDEFNQFGADLGQALADRAKVTAVNFWQDPEWPNLGDHWGIELEELITGTRTDIKGSLDELNTYAKGLVANRK